MVFTNITPFPHTLTPITNISPLTYRDAGTFLEYLETIKQWLNETLVPETDTLLENAVAEFQTGIANAEATVNAAKAGWQGEWDEWTATTAATIAAFETSVNAALAESEADITAEKAEWQASFNAFMANVEAELAALNDAAVGGLVANEASATGAAILAKYTKRGELVISVKDHGAKGDGVTDDKAAIDAAFAAAVNGGIVVFPHAGNYFTSGAHTVPVGTVIQGFGATVTHTGNNVCFNFNNAGDFNLTKASGIDGLKIVGNGGVNAVAIEAGNAWGFHLERLNIAGYSAGVGIDFHNASNWLEGATISSVQIGSTKTGIRFRRTTGTSSFAYTNIQETSINVPANGIGVDLGAESASQVYLYNAFMRITTWLYGDNSIGFRVGATALTDNVEFHVTGELMGAGVNRRGIVNAGGTLKGYGHFNVKDSAADTALGTTRILAAGKVIDSKAGTSADGTFTAALVPNGDLSHDAMFGYLTGANKSVPFVSGFDQFDAFRAYSTPLNGSPSTGKNVFRVNRLGNLYFGATATRSITEGTGKPAGVVTANRGSLYVRSDDTGGLAQIYVKTTDADNAGWVSLEHRRVGTTAQRPAAPDTGTMYYDTDITKPVWWNGQIWRDATGAAA